MIDLTALLTYVMEAGASDVHVVPYHPPVMVLHKQLQPVPGFDVVAPEDTKSMVMGMVGQAGMDSLLERRDWDFSHKIAGVGRYRVNAHFQRECIGICFRTIKSSVPPLADLNLPPVVKKLTDLPRGLVLMTGPTGSGKSTTLASLIDRMNQSQSRHVITIEDPIEYELVSNQCLIEQREFGSDVPSFASGLKHALRQAPDVILVGEMRDLETTTAAISAAETGHLVLSTLHTQSASQTIERIIDIYPAEQQRYILSMLSNTLQAVVTQTLFTQISGQGMVPALEVMICNSAVRSCIRENRIHEIPNIIETNRAAGMCLLDDAIKSLYLNGQISFEQALERANHPATLRKAIGGAA